LRNLKIKRRVSKNAIFDVLYGFIPITEWEAKIIDSPYFQRLRWIKQLGFSNSIFPGTEHNRFAHAIGVMHSMHQMIRAVGIDVTDEELFDPKSRSQEAMLHKSLRIAALLHDIGTFPFSHAIEYAYIQHGNDARRSKGRIQKDLPNSHEHLGSYIIKNTRFAGGMTEILESYGLDVSLISKIIKGDSKYLIANQLMHSDLDADRMDYLLRDAHYTGLKYGQFDRDYLLANLEPYSAGGGQWGFGVRESALRAVEDFLISRFNWYSQVIHNPESAKFDIVSSHLAELFLKNDLIHQFDDLLEMIKAQDERFFWWNDIYFMSRCQEIKYHNKLKRHDAKELITMLLYRKPPKTLNHPLFKRRVIASEKQNKFRSDSVKSIQAFYKKTKTLVEKNGTGKEWMLLDIPKKDVVFTTSRKNLTRTKTKSVMLRDPIKIIQKDGTAKLLVDDENSLMRTLADYTIFAPSLYVNDAALKIIKKSKL